MLYHKNDSWRSEQVSNLGSFVFEKDVQQYSSRKSYHPL